MHDNILQTLRAEHEILRATQELVLETSGQSGLREQLWFRLKEELLAHAAAEEKSLYRDLKTHSATRDAASHSIEEHDTIEELIAQLDHVGFDQPSWLETLKRLVHVSNHHLDEEETELFPVAGRVLSDTQKAACVSDYREAKLAFRTRHADALRKTTHAGRDGRTLDSLDVDALRAMARERGITPSDRTRSELVSALRGAPRADA